MKLHTIFLIVALALVFPTQIFCAGHTQLGSRHETQHTSPYAQYLRALASKIASYTGKVLNPLANVVEFIARYDHDGDYKLDIDEAFHIKTECLQYLQLEQKFTDQEFRDFLYAIDLNNNNELDLNVGGWAMVSLFSGQ
jgi:hypothetical protein